MVKVAQTVEPTVKTTVNNTINEEGYTKTNKKYGDYYNDDESKNNLDIYKKDNKLYYKGNDGKYNEIVHTTGQSLQPVPTQVKETKKEKTNATINFDNKKELKYQPKEKEEEKLSPINQIKLDTEDLTKEEKKKYKKSLLQQEEQEREKSNFVRRSGTGIDALTGAYGNVFENPNNPIQKEIAKPLENAERIYESGKLNNKLALEWYKKAQGKSNNVEEIEKEIQKFNNFNQDIASGNVGWLGESIQNANTQVESLKNQGIAATGGAILGGGLGALVGLKTGDVAGGALKGSKLGAKAGYAFGSTPYMYKLEYGNSYKDMKELGVSDKKAKNVATAVASINSAIESGENIVDLLSFSGAGKLASSEVKGQAANKMADDFKDIIEDLGEEKAKSYIEKKFGPEVAEQVFKTYTKNAASESLEEGSQELTSILGERYATKSEGINRGISVKEDAERVGKSALAGGSSALVFGIPTSLVGNATSYVLGKTQNAINNMKQQNNINTQDSINTQQKVKTKPTIEENNQIKAQQLNQIEQDVKTGTITPEQGQAALQQVQTRVEPQTIETKPVAKLTQQEQQELNNLQNFPFELDEQQERRMDELLLKQNKDLEKNMSPVRDLSDVRDFSEVGSPKINAYQYDNPEVKPYFQEVAKDMLYDLDNSTKGERYMTEDGQFKGIKRNVPNDIAELLDGENGVKYSYKEIEDGLNAIIKDNGAENKAVAKRLEFYIDQRLRNGYMDSIVGKIPANNEYIETLRNKNAGENPNIPVEKAKEPVLKVETKGEKGKQFFEEQGAKPEVAKILSETPRKEKLTLKEKTKNFIENQKNSLKEFRRSFVDKGQEIADIDRAVKDNGKTYAKYDFLALSDANAQYQIGDGQTTTDGKLFKNFTDKDGNKVSKSLKGLWEDVDNAGLKDVMDEYIAHYLNTDVYGRPTASSQRETDSILNMVESGFISPEEAKSIIDKNKKIQSVFGEAVTKKDSLKRIKEIEQQHPEIKRLAENIWQYGYNELDKMVDSGRVSKTDAEKFKKENPHYVRLQRKVEQTKKSQDIFDINKKADVSVGKGIQERKGGTQDILPFRDAMADFTRFNARQSRMNNFGLKLAQVLNTNIDANDSLVSTDESGVKLGDTIKKNDNGTYTFRIYENGKPKQIYINEGIYEALQPNKKYKLEEWLPFKATAKLSKVQRDLITGKNLLFSTTNAPKDFFNALFSTRNSSQQFLKNYFKAYAELAKNGDYAQQYKALGGNQNTYYNYEEGYIKDKSKIKALKAGQSIINGIERINNFVETAPRLAEFMSSMENGKSIEDAMYDAAEVTTNFKRGGNVTKAIDRIGANYFSPSVQGASKFVRNFSEAIENKQYAKILTRVALMGLGPALVGEIMWGNDKDYKDLPEYQKDNYYLWKTGEGKWIRIPKGQIQAALQAPIRRTIVATRGQKDAYSGLTDAFLNNVAPNNPLEDNVLGPMISVARNKSWSGNKIVSDYLATLPEEEQYDAKTSEFSKWLGKELKISPKKADYVIDQYSGVIGDLLLPTMTNYAESEDSSGFNALINPLKSKFTTNSTLNNKTTTEYYDLVKVVNKQGNSSKATALDKAKQKYIGDYSDVKTKLSSLYAEQRAIQNSTTLSDSEKYKQNLEKQRKIIELMKKTQKELKNATDEDGVISIGDKTYIETIEDGKKKIKTISSDKMNEAANLGININDYIDIDNTISNMEADRNSNGETIRGSKKQKAINYLQSNGYDEYQIRTILNGYGWKY